MKLEETEKIIHDVTVHFKGFIGCHLNKKGRHTYLQIEEGKGRFSKIYFKCKCGRIA